MCNSLLHYQYQVTVPPVIVDVSVAVILDIVIVKSSSARYLKAFSSEEVPDSVGVTKKKKYQILKMHK